MRMVVVCAVEDGGDGEAEGVTVTVSVGTGVAAEVWPPEAPPPQAATSAAAVSTITAPATSRTGTRWKTLRAARRAMGHLRRSRTGSITSP